MAMTNTLTRFATDGFRMMRLNPDGTIPRATRFLGFMNTVDLTAVIDVGDAADLTVKIDGTAEDTNTVDFTSAVDKTAVTVAEAVIALTAAAFTGITWSADATTGRLKGVSATGTYVQVYGELAAALDFGQGLEHGGEGLKWVKSFGDKTRSIGLAKNIKAKEEIDIEGALGTITRMVISSKLQGVSPVIAVKNKDYDMLELIQGGTYDRSLNTYEPPLSSRTEAPQFFIEIFSPLYAQGTDKLEDLLMIEKLLIRTCIGMEADVPIEAKAWANVAYNVESTEYTNETGVTFPAWQESQLTLAAYAALNVENV